MADHQHGAPEASRQTDYLFIAAKLAAPLFLMEAVRVCLRAGEGNAWERLDRTRLLRLSGAFLVPIAAAGTGRSHCRSVTANMVLFDPDGNGHNWKDIIS